MKRVMGAVLLASVCFLFLLPSGARAEIRFGVLPRLSAVELTTMFTPLADYLTKETGEKVTLVLSKDFDAFEESVKAGNLDLAFSNPLVYVQLKKGVGLDLLALSAEKKAGTKFRGILIVRKDSGIEKVQDLKGKKLIFVDQDSVGGYLCQALLLKKVGFDLAKDFVQLPFAKKHDNVTLAVFNKAADAGGIREDDLEKMKEKVDLEQLKILAYSDYFPNWPMYANSKMDQKILEKLKSALLQLKPENQQNPTLDAAKLTGFVPVADKDYDALREAAKLVGLY